MKNYKNIILALLLCCGIAVFAQRPVPAPQQSGITAITGATIHTATGTVLPNSTIVFENGRISSINQGIPVSAKVIDASGKHLYPGFILLNNTLGLIEISATHATDDTGEANSITPEVRTLISWNTDSHVIPTIRTNGILLAQPVMKGGLLSGTSSVMNLDSWNWEDAVVARDSGLHLAWPANRRILNEDRNKEYHKQRDENLKNIRSLFARAKSYTAGGQKDYKLEAIEPVYSGKKTLFIEVPGADEGLEVIKFAKDNGIGKTVLIGDSSLLPILDDIKSCGFPLILTRVHSLPVKDSDSPRLPYEFAKLVSDKGILYALDYSGDMEYQGSRNLPFLAGTTVAYGVDKEKALQSITINAAKIVGIEKEYGSLEVGKSATLFISDGDAFDPLTNQVTAAFIDGRSIDLNNQQKELYRRYREKYSKK